MYIYKIRCRRKSYSHGNPCDLVCDDNCNEYQFTDGTHFCMINMMTTFKEEEEEWASP